MNRRDPHSGEALAHGGDAEANGALQRPGFIHMLAPARAVPPCSPNAPGQAAEEALTDTLRKPTATQGAAAVAAELTAADVGFLADLGHILDAAAGFFESLSQTAGMPPSSVL
ncbi:hypothetical protein ACIQCR_31245 [Streptomyces sp. NPDC093249]|uniref:hypothetical protein n=1 Tax=unclassified Streptomyces TaxID=2593676 RepID=UPI00344CC504